MPALVVLAIDCSDSSSSHPVLPPTGSFQVVHALPSVRFIALYHVPDIDVRRILQLAPNVTHLALRPEEPWDLKYAIDGHLPHLNTLSVRGKAVNLGEVRVVLGRRSQTVRMVEMSSAAMDRVGPWEANELEWLQAHTSLRSLHDGEFEAERVLQRWGVQI